MANVEQPLSQQPSAQKWFRSSPISADAKLFVPPDREVAWWAQKAPRFLAPVVGEPALLARFWAWLAVAPYAHLTLLNVEYQVYLARIFHQSLTAKVLHGVSIPLNLICVFAAAATVPYAGPALLIALCVWYAAMAWATRDALLGIVLVLGTPSIWLLGELLQMFVLKTSAAPMALPLLGVLFFSFVAAASHGAEPAIPPRTNGSHMWLPMKPFVSMPGLSARQRVRHLARLVLTMVVGTLAEWWAAPRIMAVGTLQALYWAGHAPDRSQRFERFVVDAVGSGQPAVDFIGIGGGLWLSELPKSE